MLPLFNIFGLLYWAQAVIGNRVCFDFEDNIFFYIVKLTSVSQLNCGRDNGVLRERTTKVFLW